MNHESTKVVVVAMKEVMRSDDNFFCPKLVTDKFFKERMRPIISVIVHD